MVSCDFDLLTCYFVHKKNPQPKKPTRVSKKNPTKNPTPDFFLKKKNLFCCTDNERNFQQGIVRNSSLFIIIFTKLTAGVFKIF